MSCCGNFPPLLSIIGGIVSQEAMKAITNKYKPIHQNFFINY